MQNKLVIWLKIKFFESYGSLRSYLDKEFVYLKWGNNLKIIKIMEYFADKLDNLWEDMRITITRKVIAIGVDSEVGFKTIKFNTKDFYCEADLGNSGGILTEVGIDNIFDNDGYVYGYGALTYEQLANLTDYINKLENPTNVLDCPL